ncbi:hypothetical protein PpBr36_03885 [Pyricularia pennisetigena]|nr:hypothetical protein PpBr36_03885 [Pyricularia pennisetigena]TLS29978.1 hypothetical protein PpBr36_03885 [Pyricularia pennisetigena]
MILQKKSHSEFCGHTDYILARGEVKDGDSKLILICG